MKNIKAFAFGLFLTTSLIYSGAAVSATGMIILRDKDNAICNLPVPDPGNTRTIDFKTTPQPYCTDWNDRARSIQLAEIPSATTIFITNDNLCKGGADGEKPWFLLKTIKKQTSTSIIAIEYLTTFREGQIIEPGLQMVKLAFAADNNRDKTSCVRITTSAAPPSPSSTTP